MTDFWDVLFVRRSTKPDLMEGDGLSDQEINKLINAAVAAPDHGKLQPWRFLVFQGNGRQKLGQLMAEALAKRDPHATPEQQTQESQKPLRAPVIIVVILSPKSHPTIPEFEQILSAGAACENILLAAQAMGYASKWLTGKGCYDNHVKTGLGLQDHEKIAGMLYLGKSDATPPPRDIQDVKSFYKIF